jgi:hypothetical protein
MPRRLQQLSITLINQRERGVVEKWLEARLNTN